MMHWLKKIRTLRIAKPIYIGVVIVLFFTIEGSAQCAPVENGASVSEEMVLENEMTSDDLTFAQLQNFHQRAVQKMEDFADVLTILENEEIEKALKKEVAKAALDFFEHEEVEIQWYDWEAKKITTEELGMFLEKSISLPTSLKIEMVDIGGTPPFQCTPPECIWQLNCRIIQKAKNGKALSLDGTINIVLTKKEKEFGGMRKEIWEVLLGKIENIHVCP